MLIYETVNGAQHLEQLFLVDLQPIPILLADPHDTMFLRLLPGAQYAPFAPCRFNGRTRGLDAPAIAQDEQRIEDIQEYSKTSDNIVSLNYSSELSPCGFPYPWIKSTS